MFGAVPEASNQLLLRTPIGGAVRCNAFAFDCEFDDSDTVIIQEQLHGSRERALLRNCDLANKVDAIMGWNDLPRTMLRTEAAVLSSGK